MLLVCSASSIVEHEQLVHAVVEAQPRAASACPWSQLHAHVRARKERRS